MKNFVPIFKGLSLTFLTVAGLVMCAPNSQAAFITPSNPVTAGGAAVPVPNTTAAQGTLLASLLSPYSFSTTAGTTSGTLLAAVYRNPSGTLDFLYQVMNSAGSATALARESDTSFLGFATQVAFRTDGASLPGGAGFVNGTAGIVPVTADRDASGTTVGFNFVPAPPGTKIPPGTTSAVLVISTDATAYTNGNASVIDGGTQTVAAFQPLAATTVPEPATYALFGAGLLAFAGVRRFKIGKR